MPDPVDSAGPDHTRDPDEIERPAVRPLEVQRHDGPDGPGIVLVDRLGLREPAFVPAALLPIVGRCDGTRTLAEIRSEAGAQLGEPLPDAFVRGVVRQLAAHGLLLGPTFAGELQAAAERFLAAPARPPRHAGSAGSPRDPAALRRALGDLLGPLPTATAEPPLTGLVAPHIDLARGAAGYRAAYGRLAATAPADLYVVFGTGHAGPQAPVTGLALDWRTPLGIAPTARPFVAAVHAALGAPDPGDVLQHRDEHSLEFQVQFLQFVHERRGLPPPRVAGFLCGALPSGDGDPLAEAWCQDLLAVFRRAAAGSGRVLWLAGADLAHVGPRFGDDAPVDDDRLVRLAAADRRHLAALTAGAPGAFHRSVDGCGNVDRICSAPAMTLCAALAGGRGELLHYGQARDDDGSQAVSFCAMAFTG